MKTKYYLLTECETVKHLGLIKFETFEVLLSKIKTAIETYLETEVEIKNLDSDIYEVTEFEAFIPSINEIFTYYLTELETI